MGQQLQQQPRRRLWRRRSQQLSHRWLRQERQRQPSPPQGQAKCCHSCQGRHLAGKSALANNIVKQSPAARRLRYVMPRLHASRLQRRLCQALLRRPARLHQMLLCRTRLLHQARWQRRLAAATATFRRQCSSTRRRPRPSCTSASRMLARAAATAQTRRRRCRRGAALVGRAGARKS
jgi:hypothetical protein